MNEKYGLIKEDFFSAEIEAVPLATARDLGFDSSLISGYGHDDRVCAYLSLKALLDLKAPEHTSIIVMADKEETGSRSNTGITSLFFYDFVGRLLSLEKGSRKELESDTELREAFSNSKAISADVTTGLDPDYADVFDPLNTARIGCGVVLERYTGRMGKYATSEASAEYAGWVRQIFNKAKIPWQPGTIGKVDVGGGGTVAVFLAEYNLDVIDCGVPLLNMHAPFEIASRADIYAAYLAYRAFFEKT